MKNTVYDQLVEKVDNIDTTGFVSKNIYNTDKLDLEKKTNDADKLTHDRNDLTKKADLNARITEIENKILVLLVLLV